MVGRGAWLAGAALLGYVVACNATTGPFTCADDGGCILQGTPGVCDGEGRCSYPDDACSSGYSYPAATPGVGGDCAPDPGVGDAGTDVGTTTSDDDTTGSVEPGSTSDGTTVQLDSAGSSDGSSSDDGLESSDGDASTSTGTESSGGPACADTIGDSLDDAVAFDSCSKAVGMGVIVDDADSDWWVLDGGTDCGEGFYQAFLDTSIDLTLCLFPTCQGGQVAMVECIKGGSSTEVEGLEGCCGDGGVVVSIDCTFNGPVVPYVLVTGQGAECSEYVLGAGYLGD